MRRSTQTLESHENPSGQSRESVQPPDGFTHAPLVQVLPAGQSVSPPQG